MKITLNHEKLSKSLQYTSRAVSQKPNIPVLSNVLLDVTKNGLKLMATNLDMGISVWIPGVVSEEGKTTVSAKYIADYVAASSSEKVDITLKDNVITVKTEKSKSTFNTILASEFPILPKTAEEPLFAISATDFINSMDKVVFACSTDFSAGKVQQSGVLFELAGEAPTEINFVGLDGFRLSSRTASIKNVNKELPKESIIVPAKYLQELVKIVQDYTELDDIEVFLSESKSQIVFKFEEIEFSIRLLEGPYPDFRRIMPDAATYIFDVKKSDLEEAIKIVNTFARSNLGYRTLLDLDVANSVLKLKSSVAEVGENETLVNLSNVNAEGDLNTAYNLKFLQDIVNHIKGESIKFESKGPLAASVFKDKADPRFLHLVMPLRRDV